jgi:hypothetical protein
MTTDLISLLDSSNTATSFRALADAMRADAGRRTANKRPELAELPKSALNGVADLLDKLADALPWPAAEVERAQAGPTSVDLSHLAVSELPSDVVANAQAVVDSLPDGELTVAVEELPFPPFMILWPIGVPAPHDDSEDEPEDEGPKA